MSPASPRCDVADNLVTACRCGAATAAAPLSTVLTVADVNTATLLRNCLGPELAATLGPACEALPPAGGSCASGEYRALRGGGCTATDALVASVPTGVYREVARLYSDEAASSDFSEQLRQLHLIDYYVASADFDRVIGVWFSHLRAARRARCSARCDLCSDSWSRTCHRRGKTRTGPGIIDRLAFGDPSDGRVNAVPFVDGPTILDHAGVLAAISQPNQGRDPHHKFFMTEVVTPDVWHPQATTQLSSGTRAHAESRALVFSAFPMLRLNASAASRRLYGTRAAPPSVLKELRRGTAVADFENSTTLDLLLWTIDCTEDALFPGHQVREASEAAQL